MTRYWSTLSIREIRDQNECSIQEASKLRTVSVFLDRIESATDVDELKTILAEFITYQTGVK